MTDGPAAGRTERGLPVAARGFIVAVAAGGAAVLALHLPAVARWGPTEAASWSLLVLAMVVTEQFPVSMRHQEEGETFALTDAIWVAALIIVPTDVLLLAAAGGALLGQVVQHVPPQKIAFNLGQYLIGLGLAVAIYGIAGGGPPADPRSWLAAIGAMSVFFLVNEGSVAVIISLVTGKRLRDVLLPSLLISVLHWAGNMATGVLAALLWATAPVALVLLLAPLALSYLAYRGWLRSMRERDQMQEMGRTADEITEQKDLTRRLPETSGKDAVGELANNLNAMLDRLERAFVRERRFLSEASHELRTPITVCRANLEILPTDATAQEVRATAVLVIDELERMARIVEDMTTLARMEHPTFLQPEPVDLVRVLGEVAVKARPFLGDRLQVGHLPRRAMVLADRQRVTQALLNLLQNAQVHTRDDGAVWIELRDGEGHWRVEVSDTGGGLPRGQEQDLFEPFRRGTSRRPGSGLGLAIVRAVAEAHGGAAGVDNRPTEGATFWLTIPRPPAETLLLTA